uniref:Uncharacterized protein n=1 Tax=Tanacetum cinerariifolium TaxID=118510 RepID=A0A6L2JXY1_TANCI|nr:hypothetical protein [Tanacetum cinerariifolium]
MASLVEQLAQHIDRERARDLKVCKMLLEISKELYVSTNTRKKLIDEFKEKVGSMVDMSSIRFLEGLQYREMNMRVDTLKHVKEDLTLNDKKMEECVALGLKKNYHQLININNFLQLHLPQRIQKDEKAYSGEHRKKQ